MKFVDLIRPDRKSGVWGTHDPWQGQEKDFIDIPRSVAGTGKGLKHFQEGVVGGEGELQVPRLRSG
jgi:hypothetical protein